MVESTLPLFEDYKVDLDIFEGPLDLLLHLINKDELDIYNIPIGRITEQYMAWLDIMRMLDINVVGEFVVMATTLMIIKSRMLLPLEDRSDELEEVEEIDPRLDLVRQLVEYKKFKDISATLGTYEDKRYDTYASGHTEAAGKPVVLPIDNMQKLGDIGVIELLDAFKRVLERAPAVTFGHLTPMRWRVPDQMQVILKRIVHESRFDFESLFPHEVLRGEVIATFIALLELLRLRHVTIEQEEAFGRMMIHAIADDVPDAHLPIPTFDEIDIYASSGMDA